VTVYNFYHPNLNTVGPDDYDECPRVGGNLTAYISLQDAVNSPYFESNNTGELTRRLAARVQTDEADSAWQLCGARLRRRCLAMCIACLFE
jgi:hypothetical protein